MGCMSQEVNLAKNAMKLFQAGNVSLKGIYPAVSPEVLSVFFGMYDGLIDQLDITADGAIIAQKVWDAHFSFLPPIISEPLLIYCLLYMVDKADDIYDIIGDTRVFELPKLEQNTNNNNLSLNKDGLDDIFDDLKDQLKDLWPDDEDEDSEAKHASQTNDLTKLEKELKKVMDFVNNPTGPITAEYNRALKKIQELKDDFNKFNEKLKEAARRLSKLDLKQLSNLNDAIFFELTNKLDEAIKSCCKAMVEYFEGLMGPIEKKIDNNTATAKEDNEFYRMVLIVYDLNALIKNPQPMKDYVNNYIRKKDIEALTISSKNRRLIWFLEWLSINYKKSLLKVQADQQVMEQTGEKSYKFKVAQIEGQRFCDCIRVFNLFEKANSGVKDLFIQGVKEYLKTYFPDMYKFEINMLSTCISGKTPSQGEILGSNSIDRLNDVAVDIITDTQEIIDKTQSSEATDIVSIAKSCLE